MKTVLICAFVVLSLTAIGQSNAPYLVRKHIKKDSSWIDENSNCYFIKDAGKKENNFGWFGYTDMVSKHSDLLLFEANTFGSVQLVLEIGKGVTRIHVDTVKSNSFQLINNFYGPLRRELENRNNTIDYITGEITLSPIDGTEILIDGKLNLETKKPTTHQEVVFNKSRIKITTISGLGQIKDNEKLEMQRQQEIEWKVYEIAMKERGRFYDSVFNLLKFPGNDIRASINRKERFDFTLSNSYVLSDAQLTSEIKSDLMELLGSNILVSVEGKKKVFVLHSFYDPEKNSIDDETNYSLNIEVDSITPGRIYDLQSKACGCKATLSFWHYGPGGYVILSKDVKGTITIVEDNDRAAKGSVDLKFKNTDKSTVTLTGRFELPKLRVTDIAKMEARAREKQRVLIAELEKK